VSRTKRHLAECLVNRPIARVAVPREEKCGLKLGRKRRAAAFEMEEEVAKVVDEQAMPPRELASTATDPASTVDGMMTPKGATQRTHAGDICRAKKPKEANDIRIDSSTSIESKVIQ